MKIVRRDHPYVEPMNESSPADNEAKRHGAAGQPPEIVDRVEFSRETQLKIELGKIRELMQEKLGNPKAYAVLEAQYREVEQELEELEM